MAEIIFIDQKINPFDVMRDCGDLLGETSNILFKKLPVEEFYNNLEKYPDTSNNLDLQFLDGSFCACIGGVFRSTDMARYLEQKGIKLADKRCRNGYKIEDMANLIDLSTVEDGGVLKPEGFNVGVTNLFVGISSVAEGCEGCLLLLLASLLKKQKESASKISLNIYLVEGDDSTAISIYRRLRAFDPDLDNPDSTPPFKGI